MFGHHLLKFGKKLSKISYACSPFIVKVYALAFTFVPFTDVVTFLFDVNISFVNFESNSF